MHLSLSPRAASLPHVSLCTRSLSLQLIHPHPEEAPHSLKPFGLANCLEVSVQISIFLPNSWPENKHVHFPKCQTFALAAGGSYISSDHCLLGNRVNVLLLSACTSRVKKQRFVSGSDVFLASTFSFCLGHLSEAVFAKVVLGQE